MKAQGIGLGLALVATGSAFSRAEAQADWCRDLMKPPAVGSWAEYRTSGNTLRLSVVGRETRDGEDLYWLEIQVTGTERTIIKILLPVDSDMKGVKEVVMKVGANPAMAVPPNAMGMMGEEFVSPQQQLFDKCEESERVGPETISVPMGTLTTLHYHHRDGDAWLSETVPFRLVKTVNARGQGLVLVAIGSGATSAITETPRKMLGM